VAIDIPNDAVSPGICALLVVAGADMFATNINGLNCIEYAKSSGKTDLANMLLGLAQLGLRDKFM
jgi:ankyrin repeat protein